MKYLFLDIDGVLNAHEWSAEAESCTIKPACVEQLNRILAAVPHLGIVLSSAWRYMLFREAMNLDGFCYMLRTHGVSKRFHLSGITELDEVIPTRGGQIRAWVDAMRGEAFPVERFAILDDAPPGMDFAPVEAHLVRTDGQVGLTAADADRVIAMLT